MSEWDVVTRADAVRKALAEHESALAIFSGGVDSSAVAALTHEALGDDVITCTTKSGTLPDAELDDVKHVAEEIGIGHLTVELSELDNPDFVVNDDDRCYHCRTIHLGRMYEATRDRNVEAVRDETNVLGPGEDHRPGLRTVEELEVLSPLLAHGITKEKVRTVTDDYSLSVADEPLMACLSSRTPTDLEVTEEWLSRVERAEMILWTRGFKQFRVRNHNGLVRTEVVPEELNRTLDVNFVRVARGHLKDVGFDHVTLDLHGCRIGSVSPGAEAEADADAGDDDLLMSDMFAQGYPVRK